MSGRLYSSDIFSREQAVQQQERAGESAQLQLLGIFSTAKRLLQAIQWKRLLVRKFTWRLLILKMEGYFFLRKGIVQRRKPSHLYNNAKRPLPILRERPFSDSAYQQRQRIITPWQKTLAQSSP
ncbi:MAG: hypothetical protein WBM35_12195, partial [Candidatus Electrothrix sp.]